MSIKQRVVKSLYTHDPHGKGIFGKITAVLLAVSFISLLIVLITEVAKYV